MTSSVSKYIWNDIVAFQFQFLVVYLLDLGPDSKFKKVGAHKIPVKILKKRAGHILYKTKKKVLRIVFRATNDTFKYKHNYV